MNAPQRTRVLQQKNNVENANNTRGSSAVFTKRYVDHSSLGEVERRIIATIERKIELRAEKIEQERQRMDAQQR